MEMSQGNIVKTFKASTFHSPGSSHREGSLRFVFQPTDHECVGDEDGSLALGVELSQASDEGQHSRLVVLNGIGPERLVNDRGFSIRQRIDVDGTGVVFDDDRSQLVGE
jgi:hypothetical protein